MIISSMTSIYGKQRDSSELITTIESVRRHHALGFRVLDLSLNPLMRNEGEFAKDDWKEQAYALKAEADRLGVTFYQSHLPFRSRLFPHEDAAEVQKLLDMTMRAVEIAGIAHVKWAVVHPIEDIHTPAECFEAHIKANHEFYAPVIKRAHELGVGIAFENVPSFTTKRRFGGTADELIALIDSYNSPLVGACWDFGHANLIYGDLQSYGIRKMGKRIKALHFADNYGSRDDHLPPFVGNIKWEDVMRALAEIEYDGCLVLETVVNNNLPDALKDKSMRYLIEICQYLNELFETQKESRH
ncbi:MAG: sugar phosphate isomerase/epimerase [Clostridia bacterium]|nr:sugar phosphate isomerase/epimerase [Clostridia bacterium]